MGSEQILTYRPLAGVRLNMAHPMARNMALCMLFNEQGSRAMDLSPYQANGRLHGFGSPAKRHIGGLDFVSATPSYVEIPASFTQLNFTSEDFSFIIRMKAPLSGAGYMFLLCRGAVNADGWFSRLASNGLFDLTTNQAVANQQTYVSGLLVADTWTTLGCSRMGNSASLFKDGESQTLTSAPAIIDPATCARSAKIGVYDNKTQEPFDGKIEFLYVYRKRTLSELEHKAIHESPYSPMGYPLFI